MNITSSAEKQPSVVFLKISQISQQNICVGVSVLIKVFSCEIFEIFQNTYFEEHLRTAASECYFSKTFILDVWLCSENASL